MMQGVNDDEKEEEEREALLAEEQLQTMLTNLKESYKLVKQYYGKPFAKKMAKVFGTYSHSFGAGAIQSFREVLESILKESRPTQEVLEKKIKESLAFLALPAAQQRVVMAKLHLAAEAEHKAREAAELRAEAETTRAEAETTRAEAEATRAEAEATRAKSERKAREAAELKAQELEAELARERAKKQPAENPRPFAEAAEAATAAKVPRTEEGGYDAGDNTSTESRF